MALTDEDDIADQTAAWFTRLTSGEATEADRTDFDRWRSAAPAHAQSYAELQELLGTLDTAFIDEFANDALLDRETRVGEAATASRIAWRPWAVAASLVLLAGGGSLLFQYRPEREGSYASAYTAVGDQQTLRLSDGSIVRLNTASKLRYRLGSNERSLKLDDGEAFFQVAKDPARPFIVTLPSARVSAVGTAFNIRIVGTKTEVAVTEGVVTLDSISGQTGASYRLSKGDFARLGHDKLAIVHGMQSNPATAWTEGQLVYENRTLSDVLEDLDRYYAGRLILDHGMVGNLRVSAVINLTGEDEVLRVLSDQLPIKVERMSNGDRRISARNDKGG